MSNRLPNRIHPNAYSVRYTPETGENRTRFLSDRRSPYDMRVNKTPSDDRNSLVYSVIYIIFRSRYLHATNSVNEAKAAGLAVLSSLSWEMGTLIRVLRYSGPRGLWSWSDKIKTELF